MDPFPLPSSEFLDNAAAMVAIFGQVNLYDADLRAVRLLLAAVPMTEVDLYLPGAFALATGEEPHPSEYRITFACHGVTSVHAEEIHSQNIVGEYGFESAAITSARRLWIRGIVGCNLEVHCTRIAIAEVAPVVTAP